MAHGDYTGNQKSILARAAAEDQEFAAKRLTMVNEATTTARSGVVNLCSDEDDVIYSDLKKGDLVIDGVQETDPDSLARYSPVKFRAREDQEDITVGKDRHFTLNRGQAYKAPRWVVEHLDRQGLVAH